MHHSETNISLYTHVYSKGIDISYALCFPSLDRCMLHPSCVLAHESCTVLLGLNSTSKCNISSQGSYMYFACSLNTTSTFHPELSVAFRGHFDNQFEGLGETHLLAARMLGTKTTNRPLQRPLFRRK